MNPEDARSDFILAGAATLLGGFLVGLLAALPFYPRGALASGLLSLVWILALTALVPWLLARHRDQGIRAFGLASGPPAWLPGLALATPVVGVGVLRALGSVDVVASLLGRLGGAPHGPVIGAGSLTTLGLVLAVLQVLVLTLAALLLYTFLTTRARDAFRRTEMSVTEALRTYGMGAAGIALLLGLLRSAGPATLVTQLPPALALAVIVLLADRLVSLGRTTSRATVLAPAVVAVLAHLLGTGGLFGGNILLGLYAGALGGGVAIVVAALVESERLAWAVVPLLAAAALYPSCLSPLAFETALVC